MADSSFTSSGATIDVMIIDDHPLVREGLVRVMSGDSSINVVAEVESVEAALAADVPYVDVITLDLSLPGIDGVEGIDVLRTRWPAARVLVLTVHPEATHVAACAEQGAAGFLGKSAAPGEIRAAVTIIARGGQYFSDTAQEAIRGQAGSPRLSARELEVLRLIAAGRRVTDIASQLGVSVKTASTHKMRLQHKLGAANTAQIVDVARNHGLLT